MEIRTVTTTRFPGQRPGTSGLRKKTRVFMQPHYLENFVQSVFDALREDQRVNFAIEVLVVGGDGRYYNRPAIQTILRMAAANGFGRVLVGRSGILSTPAMSTVIRRKGALGGLLLTASHNPGGLEADFGIKYNIRNGGPAPEAFTEQIYKHTLTITHYLTCDHPDVDLDREGTSVIGNTRVTVMDPLADYTAVMEELFDFDALRALFGRGFRMLYDAMHGVTGPYARRIFEECLGAPEGTVLKRYGRPVALVTDANEMAAAFPTKFGVENPDEIVVGVAADMRPAINEQNFFAETTRQPFGNNAARVTGAYDQVIKTVYHMPLG